MWKKKVCHRKWSTNNGRTSISFHIHVNLLEATALETRTDAVQSPMLYLDPYYSYWFPANMSRISKPSTCWDGQWSSMVVVFFFFPPHPHICTGQTKAPLETTKFGAIYLSLSPSRHALCTISLYEYHLVIYQFSMENPPIFKSGTVNHLFLWAIYTMANC